MTRVATNLFDGVDKSRELKVFRHTDLGSESNASICDLETVASYSWLDTKQPAILVPGAPFAYQNIASAFRDPADSGYEFVDQASARLSDAPLLPLFEAIRAEKGAKYDFGCHMITTDRGNLKKLLKWVAGSLDKDSMRIDVECTGEGSLVFRKWEAYFVDKQTKGFRTNFVKRSMTPVPGCEKMLSHTRALSYNFAGIPLLVRFECDGFLKGKTGGDKVVACPKSALGEAHTSNDLVKSLLAMQLGERSAEKTADASQYMLNVHAYSGYTADHTQLMELKTRAIKSYYPIDCKEIYTQAFWSQTPATIVAMHQSGRFEKEEIYTLDKLRNRAGLDSSIGKVGWILKQVLEVLANKEKGYRASIVYDGARRDALGLYEGGNGAGRTRQSPAAE